VPLMSGRNFDEVLRLLDSCQLTAQHQVATPVNWKRGARWTGQPGDRVASGVALDAKFRRVSL